MSVDIQAISQLGKPWPLVFAIVTGYLTVVGHLQHGVEHGFVQVDGHVGLCCFFPDKPDIKSSIVGDQEICAIDGLFELLQGFSFVTGAKFCQAFPGESVDLDGLFLNPALVLWPVEEPALLGHLLKIGIEYLPGE